jgi:hypothetical protein
MGEVIDRHTPSILRDMTARLERQARIQQATSSILGRPVGHLANTRRPPETHDSNFRRSYLESRSLQHSRVPFTPSSDYWEDIRTQCHRRSFVSDLRNPHLSQTTFLESISPPAFQHTRRLPETYSDMLQDYMATHELPNSTSANNPTTAASRPTNRPSRSYHSGNIGLGIRNADTPARPETPPTTPPTPASSASTASTTPSRSSYRDTRTVLNRARYTGTGTAPAPAPAPAPRPLNPEAPLFISRSHYSSNETRTGQQQQKGERHAQNQLDGGGGGDGDGDGDMEDSLIDRLDRRRMRGIDRGSRGADIAISPATQAQVFRARRQRRNRNWVERYRAFRAAESEEAAGAGE